MRDLLMVSALLPFAFRWGMTKGVRFAPDKMETLGEKPVSSNVIQRNQRHQETPV